MGQSLILPSEPPLASRSSPQRQRQDRATARGSLRLALALLEPDFDVAVFATDFPHIENEWPNSRRVIDKIYADGPEVDKRKIGAGNAVEFFKLAN